MKRILLLCVILALASASFARGGSSAKGLGGLSLTFALPQGEFKESIDRMGFGFNGYAAYQPIPYFAIGAGFAMLIYGSETRTEPFSTTIPDVFVDVTTSNNIMQGHLLMRFMGNNAYVKPYIEGRVGFNYLWTDTKIEDIGDQEEVASSTNFDDIALSYGGGGGLMIKVWDRTRHGGGSKGSASKVFIDLNAIYSIGGSAEYLQEGSVYRGTDGSVLYLISESKTDLLSINVGVSAEF
jgi:hypothetical protein